MAYGYFDFKEFAEALGLKNLQRVYHWEKHGYIKVVVVGGIKMIKQDRARKFLEDWERSCSPREAAHLIGVNPRSGSMANLIRLKVVRTIKVHGQNRILRSSIEPAKKYVAGKEERILKAGSKLGKSGRTHRWTSAEASVAAFKRHGVAVKVPMHVYKPKTLAEAEHIGTKKLTTAEEIERVFGGRVDLHEIRSEEVGDQTLYYIHSVQMYALRML